MDPKPEEEVPFEDDPVVQNFGQPLRLPGLRRKESRRIRVSKPGARPGLEGMPNIDQAPAPGQIAIECTDIRPERVETRKIEDLEAFLKTPRPEDLAVRWINVMGLHPFVVHKFKTAFELHTLAAEDVLNVPQRPGVHRFDHHLFLVARILIVVNGKLQAQQVSCFLFKGTLITFLELHNKVWKPILKRLEIPNSRMRTHGADYLLYTLLDQVVDCAFPILEQYGDALEALEAFVVAQGGSESITRIHAMKRDLGMLRKVMWPMQEVVAELQRDESGALSDITKTYLRDVRDHALQIVDVIETYREMARSLADLQMSVVSNRMNEIMKVLTIMASFFIPITFVAGVYGMNFENIPELKFKYSYFIFWTICIGIVLSLYIFFRRKGWLGSGSTKF